MGGTAGRSFPPWAPFCSAENPQIKSGRERRAKGKPGRGGGGARRGSDDDDDVPGSGAAVLVELVAVAAVAAGASGGGVSPSM